ncbi:putative disease resistance protein RGA1 [Trifolium repens]|nr:putative disease resistance protein RGA1 [Trifolium repens]
MAEGLLFNMIEKLIGKLGSMALESWNMRGDLEKLVKNMSEIKAVVLDAEEQQSTNNRQVQLWLEKLKDALEDAEDLLDEFNTEELRRQVMKTDPKMDQIFCSFFNQLFFNFEMVLKIKELGKRIAALNVDKKDFKFTNRTPEQCTLKQRETHSFVREQEVIGREEEKKELLELLFDTSINAKENVSVISIIGVGGLGKTTLAQLLYGDQKVQQYFELKKWVCVSEDFNVKGIASKIIESNSNVVLEQLQLKLRQEVEGKRYLFVLDDIWNEDRDLWLQLITLLKDGAKGSKIIVTTRSEQVAKISGSSSMFFLKGLDEKQSWKLFSQFAFKNEKNEKLESIGKEIVKKCSGVPLAITIIGSLMYSSMQTEEDWLTFKNKDLMKIDEQNDNKIFQLIKLSYDHLPFHLKKCFAFCSLFPKDFLIEKKMLIRLWIAEGLVQSSDENISLEDIGDKYFKDFVCKSLFQNITELFDANVIFQMHDIVHDLASVISGSDYLLVNEWVQRVDKKTRHVSLCLKLDSSWQVPTSILSAYKIRTFLLPRQTHQYQFSIEGSASNSILTSFRRFRVLNLNYKESRQIPYCIGKMKHLRYLDLSGSTKVEELPNSITELINLETLLLNSCIVLRELPKDLWKLVSLRHLELDGCFSLTCMPRGIEKMTNLQTLSLFVLDTTSKDSAGASELRGLNNLRGGLAIKGFECLRHCSTEAKHINLMEKPQLRRLTLIWREQIVVDVNDLEKDDIILHDTFLHSNIKALQINGFGGVRLSSLVNLSTNLIELSLFNCTRLQYLELAPLHVKRIFMTNLPSLEWIVNDDNNGDNSSAFSASLTWIYLDELPNLKGWCRCSEEELSKGCYHQLKSLDYLSICACDNLISIPQHKAIKKIVLVDVTAKVLQQAVTHSKVEFLDITYILNFKSLCGAFQHLTTVCELSIKFCNEFDPCNDEDGCYSMKWKELTNLKVLTFEEIPKMKYLPEGLQHITTTLQTLRIINCVNLTSLPEWATSLQVLDIKGCPKIDGSASSSRQSQAPSSYEVWLKISFSINPN